MSLAQLASYGAASDDEDDDERTRSCTKKFPRLERRSVSRSPSPRAKSMPAAAAESTSAKDLTPQNILSGSERSVRSMHADINALSDAENIMHSDATKQTLSGLAVADLVGFPGRVIEQHGMRINLAAEPSHECDADVARKILDFLNRPAGEVNEKIKQRKDFRNPRIYEKLIDFCGIEEKGTNFPSSMFNMKQFGPDAYYDKLADLQNKFMEKQRDEDERRKDAESKKRAVGTGSGAQVTSTTISAAIASSTSLASKKNTAAATLALDKTSKDEKPKKSKWDR